MRIVKKSDTQVLSNEFVITVVSIGHNYYVCVVDDDIIEDLKDFIFNEMIPPNKVFPDEQSYYSMYHGRILDNHTELKIVKDDPILLLGFAHPIPCSYHIPQRCLMTILVENETDRKDPYERMLFLHRSLETQYIPFLSMWLEHDRLIHCIIIDADHPQINMIVSKITQVLSTYPACLKQIVFSNAGTSYLQWDTLHTLYRNTTITICLEAHVLGNTQRILYCGQTEHELVYGYAKPVTKPLRK